MAPMKFTLNRSQRWSCKIDRQHSIVVRKSEIVKTVRYFMLSPIGIAVVLVHWIVVIYAMFGDQPPVGFNETPLLFHYLIFWNFPALILTNLIVQPVIYGFGITTWSNHLNSIVAVIFVTLQWLAIGGLIQSMVAELRTTQKESEHLLRNELK